jgi:hypothetical protein
MLNALHKSIDLGGSTSFSFSIISTVPGEKPNVETLEDAPKPGGIPPQYNRNHGYRCGREALEDDQVSSRVQSEG